jgi:hypothetical protein
MGGNHIMKNKKYFVSGIVLNAITFAFATCMCQQPNEALAAGDPASASLGRPGAKFGPTVETVLPATTSEQPEILDLESGRLTRQEPLERFKFHPDAIMGWIRNKGLDISCNVWSTGATCVTYDMTTVGVAAKCWNNITEEEILGNPALAPKSHSPRRLLVLGKNRPDTYIFRTGEGTLGILQIVGLSKHGGVKIRYKMINPVKAVFTAAQNRLQNS